MESSVVTVASVAPDAKPLAEQFAVIRADDALAADGLDDLHRVIQGDIDVLVVDCLEFLRGRYGPR